MDACIPHRLVGGGSQWCSLLQVLLLCQPLLLLLLLLRRSALLMLSPLHRKPLLLLCKRRLRLHRCLGNRVRQVLREGSYVLGEQAQSAIPLIERNVGQAGLRLGKVALGRTIPVEARRSDGMSRSGVKLQLSAAMQHDMPLPRTPPNFECMCVTPASGCFSLVRIGATASPLQRKADRLHQAAVDGLLHRLSSL